MSTITRLLLPALLLLIPLTDAFARSLPETRPDRVGLDPERLERIDEQMQQAVDDGVMVGGLLHLLHEQAHHRRSADDAL